MYKCAIYLLLFVFCSLIYSPVHSFGHETSIQKIVDSRVYLKPGSVQIAKNGIFINIEGELLAIDHLESDDEGVYFETQRMSLDYCETCGLPVLWGKCLNPVCPSKKKKEKKEKKEE